MTQTPPDHRQPTPIVTLADVEARHSSIEAMLSAYPAAELTQQDVSVCAPVAHDPAIQGAVR